MRWARPEIKTAKAMANKVLLMILDGWGKGDHGHDDVVFSAHPEYIDSLEATYPSAQLRTDGENVGLPEGQMGNSEVGHLNIGAGRVVYQDLVKINRACRDDSILKNPEIVKAFSYAKENGKQVHFMGLVSDGGVHSSLDHLFKLCDISKHYGVDKTFVHCFMDGRDTDPRSGKGFIEALQSHLKGSAGRIASIVGRYYAMDRDKRWERVKLAYDLLVKGEGEKASDPVAAVQKSYDEGVTDEFIKPIVCVDGEDRPLGTIREGDVVIFFNFRNDRAKELTIALTQQDMPEFGMKRLPLYYCCMTPYDAKFEGLHILFDKVKKAYKKFAIKGFDGQNDVGSMQEVLQRRFTHYREDPEDSTFKILPDLILLDGGDAQVHAVLPVLAGMHIDVPVFGMVKDSKHRTRAISTGGGEIQINANRQSFTLVSSIQEEVHRFAVSYHHQKHKKSTFNSTLLQIEGIGPAKAKALLKTLKTVTAVREATQEQLAAVPGISRENAKAVYAYYHGETAAK